MIVTHEFDPRTVEKFQEVLAWTRGSGKFSELDKALRKEHIENTVGIASCIAVENLCIFISYSIRSTFALCLTTRTEPVVMRIPIHSAIMTNVHAFYWDRLNELIKGILIPSLKSDGSLQQVTQLKRLPWGNRTHTANRMFSIFLWAQQSLSWWWMKIFGKERPKEISGGLCLRFLSRKSV